MPSYRALIESRKELLRAMKYRIGQGIGDRQRKQSLREALAVKINELESNRESGDYSIAKSRNKVKKH